MYLELSLGEIHLSTIVLWMSYFNLVEDQFLHYFSKIANFFLFKWIDEKRTLITYWWHYNSIYVSETMQINTIKVCDLQKLFQN